MITVKDLYMLDDNIDLDTKWFVLDMNGSPVKNSNSNVMLGLENAER